MKRWVHSGIFRKILFSILVVSLVPLVVLGGFALRSGSEAGSTAIARSQAALDAKAAEALELRAVETANAVARFLEEREADLQTLALLPRTAEAYLSFSQAHQATVWGADGQFSLPLYREIAFIDPAGREVVRVSGIRLAASDELRDVSRSDQTLFPRETYFSEAVGLPPGQVYVSPVIGYYLSPDVAQAGLEKPDGLGYDGIVRWALAVYEGGVLQGVVTLAMDHRHLQEFTDHVVPTAERFAPLPDATTGNYAYLVDADGWVIAHPRDYYIRGLQADGSLVPALNEVDHQVQEARGEVPLNLAELGFTDPNLPLVNEQAQMGQASSVTYYWAGHDKSVAYAPILYHSGRYSGPGGFGWVGLGADVDTFHQAAILVGAAIQEKVRTLTVATLAVLVLTSLAVLVISGLLARQIAIPIQRLIEAARSVERDDFQLDVLDPLIQNRSEDEIVRLACVFHEMAAQVQKREQRLRQEVQQLRIEIDEVKKARQVTEITETEYFKQLQKRARELKNRAARQGT
jgi:HAMP domain-containing protein